MKYYDEKYNLVTLSNTFLKYYGAPQFHYSIPEIDELLEKGKYKKIVVMLFDGLGSAIQEKHLKESDIIRKKKFLEITSVFPPTTVAATTAFLSGKYPKETSWLGWSQYFKNIDKTIDMFSGRDSFKGEIITPNPSYLYANYENIINIIHKYNSNVETKFVYPDGINDGNAKNLKQFEGILDKEMKEDRNHFIYAYWTDPDSSMHEYGTTHPYVHNIIREINRMVANLAKNNKDNLIVVIADHGLVDLSPMYLDEHKDLYDLIIGDSSIDHRAGSFRIKEGKQEEFKNLFNKYYSDCFDLYTKQEVIDQNIFGLGDTHHLFEEFLGDFLAISTKDKYICCPLKNEDGLLKGGHSGDTPDERRITVSIINK